MLGVLAGLANRQILDGNRFANHVDEIRRSPAVARQVGQAITTQVLVSDPDLVALRPLIEATATALVSSSAFSPIVRTAARQVHAAFTQPQARSVALRLSDVGAVLTAALTAVAPSAASKIPPDLSVTLAQVGGQSFAAGTIHLTRLVHLLAWLLPLLALVCFVAGVFLARDRLRGVLAVGWAVVIAGAGVGLVAIAGAAYAAVADENTVHGSLIAASWRELGGFVWRASAFTVLGGAVLLAAASARIPQLDPSQVLRRAWTGAISVPSGRGARVGHGVALLAVGAATVLRPLLVAEVALALIGLVLLVAGLSELAMAAGARRPAEATGTTGATGARARQRWPAVVAFLAAGALIVGVVAIGAAPSTSPVTTVATGQSDSTACEGHVQLCDRRYNDVAFAAAHNAMSAADAPGWFLAEQPTGPVGALDAGIRTLLIDSYYGQSTNTPNVVATAPQSYAEALAQTQQQYGQQLVDSALRVRNSITGSPTGPVRPYLCHGLCETGATAWAPLMVNVKAWMDAHPREVVTFFIEDYVSPADTAKIFTDAGLLPYIHTQKAGEPWPTLRQMIDSGRRLVVLMENHGGGTTYPWLLQGFDYVQDTPYSNPTVASLSCRLNRGSASDPLLLINNWLSGFSSLVTNAQKVNAYDVLDPYVRRCQTDRKRLPNYVAVNFYNEPDVFRVVDQLNGVS